LPIVRILVVKSVTPKAIGHHAALDRQSLTFSARIAAMSALLKWQVVTPAKGLLNCPWTPVRFP
jgi:hypothetical protein